MWILFEIRKIFEILIIFIYILFFWRQDVTITFFISSFHVGNMLPLWFALISEWLILIDTHFIHVHIYNIVKK